MILEGKRIVLGVTGSIAAYKAVYLASALTQAGAVVDVVMTPAAGKFVGALSFEGITGRPAYASVMQMTPEGKIAHVELGHAANAVLIAPATADTLARLAAGMAADMVTATVLCTSAPVIVAPAMEAAMYANAATQANLEKLRARGVTVIEPEEGRLASGRSGRGRLPDPETIIDILRSVLGRGGALAGRRVVVTAGGTQGQIDPVRFITNPSTGRQGIAIAEAARDRGAEVTLIVGRHSHRVPAGMRAIDAPTYARMREAVLEHAASCDALVMAAAINDFEPSAPQAQKIKKSGRELDLRLRENPDFLLELKGDFVKVGFAAETERLAENAAAKLAAKALDAIVANDVTAPGAGFGGETNKVMILRRGGKWQDVPPGTKEIVAEAIVEVVCQLLTDRRRPSSRAR